VPGIRILVSGAQQVAPAVLAAIHEGSEFALEKIGLRGVQILHQHTPVGATGNLSAGQFAQLHKEGGQLHEIIAVGPPADVYASPAEFGTKPHFPPPSALLLWVQKKLGITDEKKATSVAFAIAKTIARRGTKGSHMFDIAFKQLESEAAGIFQLEIAEALQRHGIGGQ